MNAPADKRQKAEKKGRRAEWHVAIAYLLRGYQIIDRRFRSSSGEVDLIVRKEEMLAFVEVKARADFDEAIFAVTPKNRQRVERAAVQFLSQNPRFARCAIRYDIAAVAPGGLFGRIKLLKDAWRARR